MSANNKNPECMICNSKIKYLDYSQDMNCEICGKTFQSNTLCEKGHYVCDNCHKNTAWNAIIKFCLETEKKDVVDIVEDLFNINWVHMHGPEHHFLVAAALLTAYSNMGYGDKNWNLKKALQEARIRSNVIPGGVCGFWGCCGAALSVGIFAGIIAKVSPLSTEERGNANLLTSKILEKISKLGGPRCCKRETYISVLEAIDFVNTIWNIDLGKPREIHCNFHQKNNQCIGRNCPFNPL